LQIQEAITSLESITTGRQAAMKPEQLFEVLDTINKSRYEPTAQQRIAIIDASTTVLDKGFVFHLEWHEGRLRIWLTISVG
jgi:hypothetical protein